MAQAKTARKAKAGAKASVGADDDKDDGKLPKGHKPPADNRPRITFPLELRHWEIVEFILPGVKSADDPAVTQLAQQLFRQGVIARKREIEKAMAEHKAAQRAGIA